MPHHSLGSIPVWNAADNSRFSALSGEQQADVCIVGAGIAGLSTAYLLQKEGVSVAVVDARGIAGGETGRTTMHLTTALDERYFKLETLHGTENCRLIADSHRAAIDKIEAIIRDEAIDCQFMRVDGYLTAANGEDEKQLEKEVETLNRIGLTDVALVSHIPLEGYDWNAAIRYPNQACLHATRYIDGLAKAFERMGGRIYIDSTVRQVKGGSHAHIATDTGARLNAGSIVVATNTPMNDRVVMHTKQVPNRTYAISIDVAKDSIPPLLIWDTETPYHYVRLLKGTTRDHLITGGEDHKTGHAADAESCYRHLEEWTRARFPGCGEVTHRWSGQILEPLDHIAYIGRNPMDDDNVYIVTGTSGNGTTYGTIAGMVLTDLIQGRENPYSAIYDPSRKPAFKADSLKEYARFNSHAVAHMGDHLKAGEVDSPEDIQPGTGAVVRRGMHKIAMYRDEEGMLHERSAVCPHLGCIVKWNAGEKSWDCPCHGSRFTPDGEVLNGPSSAPLDKSGSESLPQQKQAQG